MCGTPDREPMEKNDRRDIESEWEEIRQATQRGRLFGRETFHRRVEAMTGRCLVGEARGRPKKTGVATIKKIL